ncbi:MAG: SDR family NAD(P)-dependent oxidoreductase [Alphaproteobacteria bacterium]|nr:SDR family NAD(P)-dependent oxidoreductase [Alphaproteobacteria bacterium]MBL6940158.1 SDR family NAD(P)-dependent oxidoreductase [Alphaproteobacteria bacterium]MBL7100245.1 SDR family NAD(P)-dependent oxidoreductase [Alphaproteobacteria bacterium]
MKSVVVTGSSTGIGWGIAKVLIQKGFRVFGSVRKAADGERLEKEFGPNFMPVPFDVTDAGAVARGAEQVAAALGGETLAGLVNNAGIAVAGPLLYMKIDEFKQQIEVNLTGQLIVTQAFAPLLGVDRSRKGEPGRIVMISSVGGKNANPFLGPYNASKFGLEGMSESLRRELMLFGIDVIVVGPGAVATPIWDKAEQLDVTPYANTPYAESLNKVRDYMIASGRKGFPPEKLGEAVHTALTTAKPKTRYTVTPEPLQNFLMLNLPKRTVDNIIAGQLGLKRKAP